MASVLVTGAARGIGRATVARLAAHGWDVLAGVRREEDVGAVGGIDPARVRPVILDLTAPEHLAGLSAALPARLDAVVANAGIAVGGPLEALRLEDLRRQLEVNLVGQLALAQAVLPALRESRGRIVFVSSLSGRIASPSMGAYVASKFALEGMADSLRLELAPWRVRVVLVEPAQTDTDLWQGAEAQLEADVARLRTDRRELYARHIDGARRAIPRMQRMAAPVEGAAATIERALTARRPRARYVVGRGPRAQAILAGLTPTPVLDIVLRAGGGVPWRGV
jgi:NAD(P)-dependent dehydrogenase (short-subunit alcohol dehydrogenase family)